MIAQSKRLAIFIPSMCGDGAERTMLNLAQGVAERGYAVDLVLARAADAAVDQALLPLGRRDCRRLRLD